MQYYNAGGDAAQEEKEPSQGRNVTVTSVRKCYAQLSREDVLDIQKNYIKPYQECQRRLAAQLKKKKGDEEARSGEDSPAETKGDHPSKEERKASGAAEQANHDKKPRSSR